ncbi:hypothetical protein MAR_027822 [Mya arenaria]|uniref:Uncharacterized protein n=1 Tax=Mya arenaria TaxID=6604 RepID=A0ABY7EUL8_MYAAR|nr:hypothetical protein MAR_027822 [Mya arenaria]
MKFNENWNVKLHYDENGKERRLTLKFELDIVHANMAKMWLTTKNLNKRFSSLDYESHELMIHTDVEEFLVGDETDVGTLKNGSGIDINIVRASS